MAVVFYLILFLSLQGGQHIQDSLTGVIKKGDQLVCVRVGVKSS